jgi:hypothetical protein
MLQKEPIRDFARSDTDDPSAIQFRTLTLPAANNPSLDNDRLDPNRANLRTLSAEPRWAHIKIEIHDPNIDDERTEHALPSCTDSRTETAPPLILANTEKLDPSRAHARVLKLELTATMWSTEIAPALRARLRMENEEPRVRESRSDIPKTDPTIPMPRTDRPEPHRARLRKLVVLPTFTNASVDRVSPNLPAGVRRDIEEPRQKKSSTDTFDDARCFPTMLKEEPQFATHRKERLLPRFAKLRMETSAANLANERTLKELPTCVS